MATSRPLSLPAASVWDYSGEWNLFEVSLGTPPQTFRLLPHITGNTVLVPTGDICRTIETDGACAARHGVLPFQGRNSTGFRANESSTWESIQVDSAAVMGSDFKDVQALYGFDTVSFSPDQVLERRVAGAFEDEDLLTGMLGLDARSVNMSRLGSPQQSTLDALRSNATIPSLSFGYGAGAFYHYQSVPASLTLGGVDTSRFIPTALSIPFSSSASSQLEVSLTSITTTNTENGTATLFTEPLTLSIDSTIPELVLPQSLCDTLATTFNLDYDNETNLYSRSYSYDNRLDRVTASLSFTFTSPSSSAPSQVINLPYGAFRLSHPLASSFSGYFPIRRASSPPYILGRVILQEAYLTVDYERRNFSLAQAVYTNPMPPVSLQAIAPISGGSGTAGKPGSTASTTSSSGLSTGAIAGVSIGAVLLALIISLGAWFLLRKRRRRLPVSSGKDGESRSCFGTTTRRASREGGEKDISTPLSPELDSTERPGEVPGETAKWGSFGVQELRTEEGRGELYGAGQFGYSSQGPVELEGDNARHERRVGEGAAGRAREGVSEEC
ncbi:Hypothetical protein D9617_4g001830 [Elsinoe fawcettii]|nr:Hypothetical protein D9617_4g001830 [Elsinoe fawcettii]